MQLNLSDDDARTMRNTLSDYLPQLRREAAATDLPSRELKAELNKRVQLCERIVAELDRGAGGTGGTGR